MSSRYKLNPSFGTVTNVIKKFVTVKNTAGKVKMKKKLLLKINQANIVLQAIFCLLKFDLGVLKILECGNMQHLARYLLVCN